LHGIVTWSDCEHVPLDLIELTVAFEVVEAGQIDHDHEYAEASDLGSHLVLFKKLLLILLASEAHKSTSITVSAF